MISVMCVLYRVKLWASAFGGEMKSISAKYSGSQLLQKVCRLVCEEMTGVELREKPRFISYDACFLQVGNAAR